MKLYINSDYVYFIKNHNLHRTKVNVNGFFDLNASEIIEDDSIFDGLMAYEQMSHDVLQLSLF